MIKNVASIISFIAILLIPSFAKADTLDHDSTVDVCSVFKTAIDSNTNLETTSEFMAIAEFGRACVLILPRSSIALKCYYSGVEAIYYERAYNLYKTDKYLNSTGSRIALGNAEYAWIVASRYCINDAKEHANKKAFELDIKLDP